MALNDVNSIYSTREQLDWARKISEALLTKDNYIPSDAMAVRPGTWMYGVPNIIKAISGAQYRDLAGGQESKLVGQQSGKASPPVNRYGARVAQPINYTGGNPDATAALNEGLVNKPSAELGSNYYTDEVKKSENEPLFSGKIGQDTAVWDVRQNTVGYGTKATARGETIDKDEAEKRFSTEWGKAQAEVDKFKPGLPEGVKAALTSMTFNTGSKWMNQDLGKAIQAGDLERAKELFKGYYHVPGEPNAIKRKALENAVKMRREREAQWFDHPAADLTKIAGQPDTGQRMNLGGPKEAVSPNPLQPGQLAPGGLLSAPQGENQPTSQPLGDQYAQAGGPNAPVRTTNPQVSPNLPQQGYGIPPANPVLTQDQLDATLRLAPAEQRAKIMEDYQKSRRGEDIQGPLGPIRVTPPAEPGGQPIVTNMPNKLVPMSIGELGLHLVPNQTGGVDLLTPDGKTLKSVEDMKAWLRKQHSMDTASQKITEGQSTEITDAISAGNKAPQLIKSLNTLDSLSKSSDVPRGPLSKYSVAVRQVIDNLGLTKYLPNIAEADLSKAETIQKINAELARQAVNSFTNRGTNFELETYIQNNPGILQSKEGMEMLIDVIRQEYRGIQEIGKIANSIEPGDIASFNAKVAEYYEKNPIIITGPIREPKTGKILDKAGKLSTRNIQNKEDVDKIPSGYYFMMPDGRIGKKP